MKSFKITACLSFGLLASMAGCTNRPTLVPNEDPALNQKPEVLAQAAAQKFPYPAEMPISPNPLPVRAELGYWVNEISLLNFGDADLDNVDVWVNQTHVVGPLKLESKKVKKIPFEVFYDAMGKRFPRDGVRIESLQLRIDDVMHKVPTQLGQ
jgi:hypothetical protein